MNPLPRQELLLGAGLATEADAAVVELRRTQLFGHPD